MEPDHGLDEHPAEPVGAGVVVLAVCAAGVALLVASVARWVPDVTWIIATPPLLVIGAFFNELFKRGVPLLPGRWERRRHLRQACARELHTSDGDYGPGH